jgi:carboxymethylenebutenolidase
MCFPFTAIPPDIPAARRVRPAMAGGAAGERLTLTSQDGTEFSAYLARADGPAGVVVLPDVRGLFRFYEQLAERFADAGHPAIAIDYFGRTAGLGPRDEDFEYMPHVQQTTPPTVAQDVAAAIERLRSETGATTIVTVGFCFGGAQSFMQGAQGHPGLAGVVGFYGSLVREGQRWTLDRAPEIAVPVLGLFAGDDGHITQDQVEAFEKALTVENEIEVYPRAPHSFFDRRQEQYADASADAWERVLRFIESLSKVEA